LESFPSCNEDVKGSKVDINAVPLWWTVYHGEIDNIKLLIASGRDFNLDGIIKTVQNEEDETQDLTAIETADYYDFHNIEALLREYQENPHGVRQRLRIELGFPRKFEINLP